MWVTLLLCYTSCSPSRAIVTTTKIPYQPSPITLDGNANDWKNVPFTFDPATTFRYAITNDSTNLYICLTSTSPGLQNKIFHMGMRVYFDTSGEKKEACGVQFPMPIDDNAMKMIAAAGSGLEKSSAAEYRKFILLQENQYETFGFPGGGNGMNAIGSTDYVTIGFNLDLEDIMVYELKVPLKNIYGTAVPPSAFTRQMSIGLHIEGIPKSEDPNGQYPSEIGMPGSQMTGAHVGLGKGGGLQKYGNGSYGSQTIYKDQRAWFRFTLATSK